MKLAASLIVRNELGRYLEPCVSHLLEFCDEVSILDDGSDDESALWLAELEGGSQRVRALLANGSEFFVHEGHARQALLEWTLLGNPSHVISLDADEFVDDGPALRRALESWDDQVVTPKAFGLVMEEVWEAEDDHLCVREDGGWRSHSIPAVWRVPEHLDASYRIADRALACGRVPVAVDRLGAQPIGNLLHFGWANEQERQVRYDRYATHDAGRFHASHHLQSILNPCDRIALRAREWPAGLDAYKAQILDRANGPSNIHESIPG